MRDGSWRWMAVVAVVLLMAACGGEGPGTLAAVDESQEQAGADLNPANGLRRMNGLCIIGHEVRTFLPCGDKKVYWIQTDQASLGQLQLAVERFTDEPYEPFFTILEGRLSDTAGDGFAADYDGVLIVERLIHLAPASELDCDQ